MKYDNSGRTFIAHHDVRAALVSANATLSTGTATSLIAGDSDYFLDIVEATFSNDSTVATVVTLTSDGTTVRVIPVPPGGNQFRFDAPLKQVTKNTPWVVDMPDITGTNVYVGATLIKKSSND